MSRIHVDWNEISRESGRLAIEEAAAEARKRDAAITVCLFSGSRLQDDGLKPDGDAKDTAMSGICCALLDMMEEGDLGFCLEKAEYVAIFQKSRRAVRERMENIRNASEGFCYGLVEILPEQEISASDVLLLAGERLYEQRRRYHIRLNEQRRLEEEAGARQVTFDYNKDLLYDALVQSTDDYIYVCNMKTGVFRYTKKMAEEFELPGEVIENAAAVWGARVHQNDRPAFLTSNQEIADGRTNTHCVEYRALNRKGEWVWVRCRGHLEFDKDGKPELFAGFITNLGKRNRIDHLTGLFNKLEFEDDVRHLMEHGTGQGFGIMSLGIDDLKHINDLYGRTFGDEVIRMISQRLQSLLPDRARLYRMDGDEFGILVRGDGYGDHVARMEQIYRTIRHAFGNQQEYEGKKYASTLSAGCLTYPDDADNYENLIQYAGYALEYSKRHGKKRCTFFATDILQLRIRKLQMVEALRESVENDFAGFSLHYQPIVGAKDGNLTGMEALARWQWEPFGPVSPVEFIPLLEETGLIGPVGRWVLKTALHTCGKWLRQRPELILHVNISFIQIQDIHFADMVRYELEREQFPSRNLVLELTESYFASSHAVVQRIFQEMRNQNIRIAMDDFGTGYSTLGLLKENPADIVKVDRAFVRDIRDSHFDATFIRFIVALCGDVGIQVCLEGVETEDEYQMVSQMGLDMIQGFLFSRPLPEEAFKEKYICTC